MPSSQRPFSLFSLISAFRGPSTSPLSASSQPNKHTSPGSTSYSSSSSSSAAASHSQSSTTTTTSSRTTAGGSVMSQLPLHSPRPIPGAGGSSSSRPGHRRGSDSSSEGFRDVLGADKWYIGGRTAAGEEKFFKLGVVKRVRSQDRLSLDRLSL